MWLRTFLLVSAFLFCSAVPSFSDITLSDSDYQEILDKMAQSDLSFAQAQVDLQKASVSLAKGEKLSAQQEQSLNTLGTVSTVLGTSLAVVVVYLGLVHYHLVAPP